MSTKEFSVVVPMDGSAPALRALRHVARSRHGGHVQVLCVNVQPGMLPGSRITQRMIDEHQTAQGEEALQPARELAARLKLDATFYVRSGDPATQVIALAKETGASEIVMGTRGLSRLGGLLLGSTATKLVQLAPVPVTLVK
jgi:nucleotide-binding universal stress UspA family protein